jgi:hypothetical protein
MFKVFDSNKVELASFDSYAKAAQYVYNNDDIAAFINDERVTEEIVTIVDAMPTASAVAPSPKVSKLLTAKEALKALEAQFDEQVSQIIEAILAEEGQTSLHPNTHPLILKKLRNLGYTVTKELECLYVYLPLDIDGTV